MVDNRHTKGFSFGFQIAANAAHAQDTKDFALRVVAEGDWGIAAPLLLTEREHGVVEVAEGAENEEHVCIGCGVVGGGGDVRENQGWIARSADVRVDLVVAGSWRKKNA